MPVDIMTHKFKFSLENGWIEGWTEFNTDGEASYQMKEWSQPIPKKVIKYLEEMTDLMVKMTHDGSKIKHISFKLKDK